MNILEIAQKLEIELTDSINEIFYGIDLSSDFDLNEIEDIIDSINDDGRVNEYADSNTPIYYSDIDSKYERCEYTIDDVIDEGMVSPMESESDIFKAKQVALYMALERDAYSDIEDFKNEINEKFDDVFGDEVAS